MPDLAFGWYTLPVLMTQTANDEVVLLTSYFNLAGGRRQDTADTFRVESSVPSSTSPEGVAALYIVTDASAGGHMGPRARRVAVDTIADEYVHRSEMPPPQRLKSAMRTAHEALLGEYDGHVSVGAGVMAIEGNVIYLALVPPAQVYVLHDGQLQSISASSEEGTQFSRALGSTGGPHIALYRDEVSAGDVLAICSSWFTSGAEGDDVRECFSDGTADDIAEAMLNLARASDVRDCTGIVIEATDINDLPPEEEAEDLPGFLEQVDSAVEALAGVGRILWTELRTIPSEDQEVVGGNGHGHQVDVPDFASSDKVDGAEEGQPAVSTPRRRRLFSGARPFRRDRVDDEDVEEPTEYEDDLSPTSGSRPIERTSSRKQEVPAQSADDEDPYGAYREQATDEVPVVSPYTQVPPTTITENLPDEPADTSHRTSFEDGATTEIEVVTQRTMEIPAIDSTSTQPSPPVDEVVEAQRETENNGTRVPAVESQSSSHDDVTPAESPRGARPLRAPRFRRSPIRQSAARSQPDPEPEPTRSSEINEVNARLGGQDMADVVPPVQAFPDTSTEPSRIYATSKDIDAANRRPRRFGGIARPVGSNDPLGGPAVIRPGLTDIDLRRPVSRPAPPAAVWGAGVLFLLLIALAGYYWYNHRHAAAAVNPYPALVRNDLKSATSAKDRATQDRWLAKAQTNLTRARQFGDTPAHLQALSSSVASTTDTLHRITRVASPTVLTDFSKFPSASPSQIATSPGLVYVLDTGRKSVYSVTANAPSTPTRIVAAGEYDTGFTIGNPAQIATDGATALILDDRNVIVRDLAGNKSATSLTPGVASPHYVQMDSSDPDIYLLDPPSNQVWRYPYGVSGYNPPANMYFDATKPPLGKAVSFVYDGSDLYILSSDGTMLKFDNAANPVKFSPDTRTPLSKPVAVYSDQGLRDLWIADPVNKRIVEIGKDGSYVRTYASNSFSTVKSMAVGPAGNTIYVLSGSKLLSFQITH